MSDFVCNITEKLGHGPPIVIFHLVTVCKSRERLPEAQILFSAGMCPEFSVISLKVDQ